MVDFKLADKAKALARRELLMAAADQLRAAHPGWAWEASGHYVEGPRRDDPDGVGAVVYPPYADHAAGISRGWSCRCGYPVGYGEGETAVAAFEAALRPR